MSKMIYRNGQFNLIFLEHLDLELRARTYFIRRRLGYNMRHECKEQHIGPGLKCALNSSGDEGEAGCA
jgi:hypothetical protein